MGYVGQLSQKIWYRTSSEMPESFSSSKSMRMNRMITRKLRENAIHLRYMKIQLHLMKLMKRKNIC